MSPLLRRSLFERHFKMVKESIVSKTANQTILHVWSQNKIEQIFTLANKCAYKVDRENHVYYLCGKIDFQRNG